MSKPGERFDYDSLKPKQVPVEADEDQPAFVYALECENCDWGVRRCTEKIAQCIKDFHENAGHTVTIEETDGIVLSGDGA